MPADLPALAKLVDDVGAAMRRAERTRRRPRWWRGWPPLVVALLVLAVPSAVALRAVVDDRRVELPPGPTTRLPVPAAGPAVAIAEGDVRGHGFTFIGWRCEHEGVVTIATGFALGHDPLRDGGGYGGCRRSRRPQPLVAGSGVWTAGQTWITMLTRPAVASIELFLIRSRTHVVPGRRPRTVYFTPTRVVRHPRAIDPLAARQGRLPAGYRTLVLFRSRRTVIRRLVARDAQGRVLMDCAGRACGGIYR